MKSGSPGGDSGGPVRVTLAMCARCRGTIMPSARFCGFCGAPAQPVPQAPPDGRDTFIEAANVPPRRPRTPPVGSGVYVAAGTTTARPDARTMLTGSAPVLPTPPAPLPPPPPLPGAPTIVESAPPWFLRAQVETVAETVAPGLPPAQPIAAGTLVGDYRIERLLGMGAMGAVYGAIHAVLGRRVAIKVLRPERQGQADASERFAREAIATRRVRHANVVEIYESGTLPDGRAYFVMEWLDGETLRARLGRPLGVPEVCVILEQVIDALAALHAQGVVHRDLKPDNVVLVPGPDGPIAKVLDLGVAKLLDGPPRGSRSTLQGLVVGSAEYLAPEQAAGHRVDGRADVYSLGVMLFELLTRRRPFEAATATDLLVEHIVETPPMPSALEPSLPRSADSLVGSMLEKDPAERPSLATVRAALVAWRLPPRAGGVAEPKLPLSGLRPETVPVVSTPMATGRVVGPVATGAPAIGAPARKANPVPDLAPAMGRPVPAPIWMADAPPEAVPVPTPAPRPGVPLVAEPFRSPAVRSRGAMPWVLAGFALVLAGAAAYFFVFYRR